MKNTETTYTEINTETTYTETTILLVVILDSANYMYKHVSAHSRIIIQSQTGILLVVTIKCWTQKELMHILLIVAHPETNPCFSLLEHTTV